MWNNKALALTVRKVISKVKVSEEDRMTDTTKAICPPIFYLGGINIGGIKTVFKTKWT